MLLIFLSYILSNYVGVMLFCVAFTLFSQLILSMFSCCFVICVNLCYFPKSMLIVYPSKSNRTNFSARAELLVNPCASFSKNTVSCIHYYSIYLYIHRYIHTYISTYFPIFYMFYILLYDFKYVYITSLSCIYFHTVPHSSI